MSTASIEWRKPAALLLALAATGGVALGARCGSATQARCSIASLTGNAPKLDVPYAGTRPEVVRLMLDMAGVRAGERVVDLGTGDGRILLAAAERGAGGLGVDIDPVLIEEARAEATRRGLDRRVRFEAQDLFRTPLRDVDVLTMFLLPEVNLKLRPRILAEMRPGARVVSHAFDMGDWPPDARGRAGGARVYLWRVPARVESEWRMSEPGRPPARLILRQRHQALAGSLDGEAIGDARVDGARVTFSVGGRRFSGVADGREMVAETGTGDWRARLTAVGPGEVGP
jgi:SAM-dependent methyltransferase